MQRRRLTFRDPQLRATLLDVDRHGSHRADVPVAETLPVKHLTAVQRQFEIEFSRERDRFQGADTADGARGGAWRTGPRHPDANG